MLCFTITYLEIHSLVENTVLRTQLSKQSSYTIPYSHRPSPNLKKRLTGLKVGPLFCGLLMNLCFNNPSNRFPFSAPRNKLEYYGTLVNGAHPLVLIISNCASIPVCSRDRPIVPALHVKLKMWVSQDDPTMFKVI